MKRTAEPRAILEAGLEQLGLSAGLASPLIAYLDELCKWNRAYNLSSVRDPVQMVTRHLLDSLSLLPVMAPMQSPSPLLDVGAGAGLPGMVLAIARPDWHVSVLDSNGKKTRFLRHVQRTLPVSNVAVIEARAEQHRPQAGYAAVTSRAFAAPADFFAVTRHLLAPGGRWLAMQGRVDDNELARLKGDVHIEQVIPLHVPGLHEARHLILASPNP